MDTRNKQATSGGAAVPIDPSDPNLPPKVRDVLTKGKTNWLKNPEVCELLVNHAAFNLPISRDAPSQPPGMRPDPCLCTWDVPLGYYLLSCLFIAVDLLAAIETVGSSESRSQSLTERLALLQGGLYLCLTGRL